MASASCRAPGGRLTTCRPSRRCCSKHHTRSSGPLADAGWLFNTRRLAIFIQLYHVNHTQTVAQQLGITQPAVSAALKVLEKERIRRYFAGRQRGASHACRGATLSPVSRALNELENIWSDLAARRGVLEGTVRIGALPLSRTRLLPSAIAAFLAQHPGITLMTNESPYESLVADMRAGNIDFIIGALRQDEDLSRTSVAKRYSKRDMLILLRNNHPLLRHPDPRSQLATAQWVLPRANAPARNLLDKAFVTLGLPLPQPTVETGDAAMVRGLLQGSDMLAAVSASQMRFETDNGLLSVLPSSPARYHPAYRADVRAGSLPSPATQALLRFIYQQVQDGAV
ncbi:LysR family transcriptional regulator [Klebsiella pneumoniae subsp. pneumoniae]|nr:LysR family transcriptional regulator [Klebsiella pneumoniae subsp. pneumoniae]